MKKTVNREPKYKTRKLPVPRLFRFNPDPSSQTLAIPSSDLRRPPPFPRRRSALRSAMASQQTAPAAPAAAGSTPSAQVVGNAFVHQYYHILHQSPEYVYRFYLEGSKLGRPDSQGGMSSVTGMEAINQKILSLDYSEIRAEIKTVDAQESLEGGVIVLVTGYLTGKDDVRRNFTQSFFLATQDKGYYVLNDIFRYVEDSDPLAAIQVPVTTPEQETPPPQEQQISERSVPEPEQEEDDEVDEEDDEVIDEDLFNPSDHEEALDEDEEIPVEEVIDEVEVPNSSPPPPPVKAEPNFVAAVPEEQPKKSYASIVKVKNVAPPAAPVPAPARPAPVKPVSQVVAAPMPAPTLEAPAASSNSTETSSIQEAEADSHSVYIKNLPLSATPAQLEEEFKKFGSIKTNGIQVRSHKQGFCFGFVEFEDASSVQTAIEASPITIGGRPAYVEEKRPAGSRGGNRGRFLTARGGYWNDGVRGRGGFGGRGYGRSDYGNRVDFGGRGGGRGGVSNRGGGEGGYQRVDSMGGSNGGRGNRPGSMAANGPSRTFAPRVPAPA